jgi:hypothetical protein
VTEDLGEDQGARTEILNDPVEHAQPKPQPGIQKQEAPVAAVEKPESLAVDVVSQKESLGHVEAEQKDVNNSHDSQPNVDDNVSVADSASQTKPIEPVKKATLDRMTVKKIPEQTSKVIQVFRTKEWAKHLADAETPELEPLELESELPEDSDKAEQAAAPVHVDGLLQTAFNAQPPPAVMSPELSTSSLEQIQRQSEMSFTPSPEMSRSKTRNSLQNLPGRSPLPLARNASTGAIVPLQEEDVVAPLLRSASTPFLAITSPGNTKETPESPRWNGPPPLLAVRENMVRNRMSSTSLRHDPWASRNASRQSLADPIQAISPTTAILEEQEEDVEIAAPKDDDDVPLSKRKVMLQRQTMQSLSGLSVANLPAEMGPQITQSYERSRSPQFTQVDSERSASRMAAWRQSVREDMTQRRDPLFHGTSPGPPSPASPKDHAAVFGDPCSKCVMRPQPRLTKPLQMACSGEV